MPREDIGPATCRRVLHAGLVARIPDGRVSAEAVEDTHDLVTKFIKTIAVAVEKQLKIKKAKTVTAEMIEDVVSNCAYNIKAADLMAVKGEHRNFPVAGTVRVLHSNMSEGLRVSDDAKKMLAAACDSYVRKIGFRAGLIAESAKRKTVLRNDVRAAIQML